MGYDILRGYKNPGPSLEWLAAQPLTTVAGLRPDSLRRLAYLLSSEWDTGFDFVSTQDGLTMGFRRYAADTLADMLEEFGFRISLPSEQPPNPRFLDNMLALSDQRAWWLAQWHEFERDVQRVPEWATAGRTIALYMRARNSSPSWVSGCHTYADLVRSYKAHAKGASRIARIQREISQGEIWR